MNIHTEQISKYTAIRNIGVWTNNYSYFNLEAHVVRRTKFTHYLMPIWSYRKEPNL